MQMLYFKFMMITGNFKFQTFKGTPFDGSDSGMMCAVSEIPVSDSLALFGLHWGYVTTDLFIQPIVYTFSTLLDS